MNDVDIQVYEHDYEPGAWCRTDMECSCGHKWIAIFILEVDWISCPECEKKHPSPEIPDEDMADG